ncbi:hypothetical protein [Arenibaculum pallidiluteum]|uniref:hypothetical protein n=1 Tax=Arenibaculum pallidiluteum TaxID=2812559 RepID=UPI001A9660DA|nr:hypothetical protein [Arenibaculum pallidiluteum]
MRTLKLAAVAGVLALGLAACDENGSSGSSGQEPASNSGSSAPSSMTPNTDPAAPSASGTMTPPAGGPQAPNQQQ